MWPILTCSKFSGFNNSMDVSESFEDTEGGQENENENDNEMIAVKTESKPKGMT